MSIVLLTSITITTIVYSAFNTELQINGDAYLRVNEEVRITKLTLAEYSEGAIETYNNKFSKDSTSIYATIPTNGKMIYEVEITNKTNKDYDVSKILEVPKDNQNIKTEISLKTGDIISKTSSKTFTLKITNNTSIEQVGTITYQYAFVEHINYVQKYDSPKSYKFSAPYSGIYMIELWGAQGGIYEENNQLGKGGYTRGNITLEKDKEIYVYVGEKGKKGSRIATFNGGGYGGYGLGQISNDSYANGASGGGATDIRLLSGNYDDLNSLKSRIMVAAGGGGSADSVYNTGGNGGHGGGLYGLSGGYYEGHTYVGQNGQGGTQISGGEEGQNHFGATGKVYPGTFGIGGNNDSISSSFGAGGGGGGYYGGGGGGGTQSSGPGQGGGGGSSYISGYKGCVAITSQTNLNPKCTEEKASTDVSCSYHYSNYKFTDSVMIAGNSSMPSPDGTTEEGHNGNGYAKITLIKRTFD